MALGFQLHEYEERRMHARINRVVMAKIADWQDHVPPLWVLVEASLRCLQIMTVQDRVLACNWRWCIWRCICKSPT